MFSIARNALRYGRSLASIVCQNQIPILRVNTRQFAKVTTAPELIKWADDTINHPFKNAEDPVDSLCALLIKSPLECRITFIRYLVKNHGVDLFVLKNISAQLGSEIGTKQTSDVIAMAKRIGDVTLPPYKYLFEKIARNVYGIKLLLDIRAILLEKLLDHMNAFHVSDPDEVAQLNFMNGVLREMFMLWFSPALLQLKSLSWELTPASLLKAVELSPAVHPVHDWIDLKRRLCQSDRRCFVFTHPALPSNDPLIILYAAFTPSIPCALNNILDAKVDDNDSENAEPNKAAIFYSITSQNKGLNNVGLGHSLIKCAMEFLRRDSPELTEFSTLSPIPGFLHWLSRNVDKCRTSDSAAFPVLADENSVNTIPEYLNALLTDGKSVEIEALGKVLLRMAARYICLEKHRGFAINPVANFHLRNGAEVYRINWLADTGSHCLSQSASIMMNYRYWPDRLHKNAHAYDVDRKVAMSEEVHALIS